MSAKVKRYLTASLMVNNDGTALCYVYKHHAYIALVWTSHSLKLSAFIGQFMLVTWGYFDQNGMYQKTEIVYPKISPW